MRVHHGVKGFWESVVDILYYINVNRINYASVQALAAVLICGIFCIIGILLRPFKVPGQNIAYNFALFTLFIISLLGLAMGSVDDLAPIGQPAHPEETSEFGVREWLAAWQFWVMMSESVIVVS